jgi:hypothetical protein
MNSAASTSGAVVYMTDNYSDGIQHVFSGRRSDSVLDANSYILS